jgi:hypothetical protein
VEQELFILPEHLSLPQLFVGFVTISWLWGFLLSVDPLVISGEYAKRDQMCVTDDDYLYYPHEIRVDSEDTLM